MAQDAFSPYLSQFRFCTTAGTATFTGHYVDENGVRAGALFSGDVDDSAVYSFADIASVPVGAVGVVFDLSADVQYETVDTNGDASDLADLQAMGPTLVAGSNLTLGRVS